MTITIEAVGVEKVQLALRQAGERSGDLSPLMAGIASILSGSTLERFDTGRAPGGSPWLPSLRVIELGGQTLVDKGNLRQSVTSLSGDNFAEVGVDGVGASSKYSYVHQFGATIRPKKPGGKLKFQSASGGLVFADSVTIPARPFLGFDKADEDETLEAARRHLQEPFEA
jgi:phage virion morphogenesis protein